MLTSALLAVVLAAPCPPQGPIIVPPDIGRAGYAFVMEISGSVISQLLAGLADTKVERSLADGGKIEIVFDRVAADAYAPCGADLRIIVNASVALESEGCVRRSRATITIGAKLRVNSDATPPSLEIQPLAETIIATDDSPQAAEVERAIREAGPDLAAKLATSTPFGGLEALIQSSPLGAAAVVASAYNLGFAWVLQIGEPLAQSPGYYPPQVFQQGDLLTLVLTGDMVSRLASYEHSAGHFPSRMNTEGLVDPNGRVRITSVTADIEPDALLVDWRGTADSREMLIRWRLGFVSTPGGLALRINDITVNGKAQEVPKDELINPIDDFIKSISIGPKRLGLLTGPLGRMRLTVGRISSEAILVAGRV